MALIHHVVMGAGGPPVVFVHGFCCDHTDWDAQVAHLSPRHRTVAVDLRGHGRSPAAPEECGMERFGADVADVLRALDLPPAVLVGHSMGCRVVVEAALQAPGHTAGLVLVDGSQFAPGMDAALRTQFAGQGGFSALANSWFKDMFTAKSDPRVVAHVLARAGCMRREIGERLLLDLQRYDVTRLGASLASLRLPVLAVQSTWTNEKRERASLRPGQSSPYLDMLRATVRNVQVVVIPDTGHFPQLDAQAATSEALAGFVSGLG